MYTKYAEARDKLGLTDYKVSELTGISRSTLSDWKNGLYVPKADKLYEISKVVGIPLEELIKKKEP